MTKGYEDNLMGVTFDDKLAYKLHYEKEMTKLYIFSGILLKVYRYCSN